jgi:hypothetical protein
MPMLTMSLIGSPVAPRQWRPWIPATEAAHLCQFGMHRRHHVLAGMHDRALAGGMAQRDVQRGAAFGVVDGFAGAHARDPARQIGSLPERLQQAHGFRRRRAAWSSRAASVPEVESLAKRRASAANRSRRRAPAPPPRGAPVRPRRRVAGFMRRAHSQSIMPISKGWVSSGGSETRGTGIPSCRTGRASARARKGARRFQRGARAAAA